MDINNILEKCHKILYEGLTTNHIGENSWLNEICGNLNDLFNYIHQFLKCKPIKDSNIFDLCFLCISQILCGIKNLHKAIQVEILEAVHLMLIRQHFLDSILWCLARLKSTILSIDDDVNPILITKMNFVNDMDTVLELIAPFAIYDTVASEKYNNTNANNIIDHENNEILTTSKNIRAIINSLLAHSLAFTNIALEDDNKALKATCRKVLKECIAFEEECSTTQFKHYEQDFCLRAAILENSLYQLDKLVNDCLLRLVITVFGDLDNLPLTKLRKLYEENCKQEELDKEIEKFDIIIDRLLQIGIFAIAFCDDQKLKSTLRSCLASIELLDTDLIPSIFSQSKYDSQILEKHWNEEIQLLRESIQFIIDTKGFCTTMIDILTIGIDKLDKQFNKIFIEQLLTQCNVLYENILLNYKLLNLHEKSSPIAVHFIDFQLMLNECKIAIQFDSVTEKRIMKRMKILLIKLKKCTALMPTTTTPTTTLTTAATPTTNTSATLIDTNANDNINIKIYEKSIINNNNNNNNNSNNNNNNNNNNNTITDDKIIIHDNEISINNNNNNNNYNNNENIININKTPNEILIDSENFFESFGIQPSLQSILYTSATIKSITSCNNSTNNNNNSFMKDLKSLNLFQSIEKPNRKRGSLRLQMFKKHNDAQEIFPMESNNKSEIESDSDFLHITNILEQLTDLSTTFSK